MINRVIIGGRLVRDPELRYAGKDNVPVVSLRIACERDAKSKDGEKQADFVDIVAWRNTAEFVSKYFSKGRIIIVDGRLQMRTWEDKDKNKRTTAEIVADSVYFGDSKKDVAEKVETTSREPSGGFEDMDDEDGELPF